MGESPYRGRPSKPLSARVMVDWSQGQPISVDRGGAGQPLSREILQSGCRRRPLSAEGNTAGTVKRGVGRSGAVGEPVHVSKFPTRESGDPVSGPPRVRDENRKGKSSMNAGGKSDDLIVPERAANDSATAPEEQPEERRSAKGNLQERNTDRTQSRAAVPNALERIREAACKDRKLRFTALWHHVYDVERLRTAFFELRPRAAVGVDGMSWSEYEAGLEERLADLSARLKRGAYRALPVRRVEISKPTGGTRPLGIPTSVSYCTSYNTASDFFRWFRILLELQTHARSSFAFSGLRVIQ